MRLTRIALAVGLAFTSAASAYTNERGLDRKNFDESVSACQDFYQYANGNWIKSNPIPPEYSTWGISSELRERNLNLLKQIMEESAKTKAAPGTNAQKIGDFYKTAMDEAAIEKAGAAPLKVDLARIDAAKSNADNLAIIMDWHAQGLQPLFPFG